MKMDGGIGIVLSQTTTEKLGDARKASTLESLREVWPTHTFGLQYCGKINFILSHKLLGNLLLES